MNPRAKSRFAWSLLLLLLTLVSTSHAARAGAEESSTAGLPGQRLVSAGHSFQMFVPPILAEMVEAAGIERHVQVVRQGLGGSTVSRHWEQPDEKNAAKEALKTGKVDVLTLSPIYLPDEGIENFATLALEHNPDVRVTIQEFWLPYDVYAKDYKQNRPQPVDRNARTAEELHTLHTEYFQSMDEHVQALNKKFGKPALYVVPAGQAVILLREKIISGEAPGLDKQNDLFRDAIGHPTPPLQTLVAYCYFAVVYQRSPEGLPVPRVLQKSKDAQQVEKLNQLLQQLAWQAAREHPLSGVKGK